MGLLSWYWVSGATGAWGKEILRQLLLFPEVGVVAYCRGEHRAAALLRHWPTEVEQGRLRVVLGDIRDPLRVLHSLPEGGTVIHGAALKCIQTALYSPTEMHSVNVDGTRTVIDACLEKKVWRAFYISTDKATFPSTFYGGTKFLAESLWCSALDLKGTRFMAARFGNALWSTGSVLPTWERVRDQGEPLPLVGDGKQTRFLLTLQEGVSYILRCLDDPIGGLLDSPPMGSVTVQRLAEAFAGEDYPLVASPERGVPGDRPHELAWVRGREWASNRMEALRHDLPWIQEMIQKGQEHLWQTQDKTQ